MSDYVIQHGLARNGRPNKAQRSSSLFAEEPMVLGKRLRRGLPPMKITEAQFEAHKVKLLRLEKAGAIQITQAGGAAKSAAHKTKKHSHGATPTTAQVVAQHEKDHQKEKAALAGDQSTVAPAGEGQPAGAVPAAATAAPEQETTAPAPDVVQESDSGKVDSTEAPTKKHRRPR